MTAKQLRFRMPCKISLYQGDGRPPKPAWMLNPVTATRNQDRSFRYWSGVYQATPPWVDQEIIAEMKRITETSTPPHTQLDHIVPLNGGIVSGLHVPWNLQVLPAQENQHKSNNYWPDMPFLQGELFE